MPKETAETANTQAQSANETAEQAQVNVDNTSNELREEIVEQAQQVIVEADKMLTTALESYVKTDDYGTFKETVEMQLQTLADSLTLSFEKSKQAVDAVDADLQEKFNTITTYFTFEFDGLTIGKTDNPYKMVLSNERYSMTVNGEEVMYIDAVTKAAYFPKLTVTESFVVLDYQWKKSDVEGLIDIDWIGGE